MWRAEFISPWSLDWPCMSALNMFKHVKKNDRWCIFLLWLHVHVPCNLNNFNRKYLYTWHQLLNVNFSILYILNNKPYRYALVVPQIFLWTRIFALQKSIRNKLQYVRNLWLSHVHVYQTALMYQSFL